MLKDSKAAVAGGLALGAGLFIFALTQTKKTAPLPPVPNDGTEDFGAKATIKIIDNTTGQIVEHNSPYNVEEGRTYTVFVTVTNQSTKAGTPWAAQIGVQLSAAGGSSIFIPATTKNLGFAANQTVELSYSMSVPVNSPNGSITLSLLDPNGVAFATGSEQILVGYDQFNADVLITQPPITEGGQFTICFDVRNLSRSSTGTNLPATLQTAIVSANMDKSFLPSTVKTDNFAAGETKRYTLLITVPLGEGGKPANTVVAVTGPDGKIGDSWVLNFTPAVIPIIYKATISFV
jgi:hypothetical protein